LVAGTGLLALLSFCILSLVLNSCRLIIDSPGEGAWNMALDEALLEGAQRDGVATVRLYSWSEPTLSLGYFQAQGERAQHRASENCVLVRRASGGGAILHDRELTYSIALPRRHVLARRPGELYDAAHESLNEALVELGVAATRFAGPRQAGDKPFLCFQRREPGDVLGGEFKIAGSAQRRQHGAVLQHGSVLLGRSEFAPELPGIAELFSSEVNYESLVREWTPRLEAKLKVRFSPTVLPESTIAAAREITQHKFGNSAWTLRR
jgi:lipoyl(octanoyl) transferase